ncbi:MAG: DUF1800 domain-containing protein [Acidobacteriota bacterium]
MTRHHSSASSTPRIDRRAFLQWSGAGVAGLGLAGAAPSAPVAERILGAKALTPRHDASRFLAQCSFGGDLAMIDGVVDQGFEGWLEQQMSLPYAPMLDEVFALEDTLPDGEGEVATFDWIWWQRALTAPDVLRQRVAFALSQIFVISRRVDLLFDTPSAIAAFHDILARGAFGSYRDLLLEVSLHATMGHYLSHLNNRRSDPSVNRFPDENFAREVMQLFSIGLYQLSSDGTRVLDANGEPIPTYGNAEITEMAKIFTGLTMAPEEPGDPIIFGEEYYTWHLPMVMVESEHEPGPKTLLDGFVVPAGQTGMQDIEMAIDHLAAHPNVGPFMGRHLIRFLVTSNPSPAYVERVAAAFDDNGAGVRGDMKAVLKAILLDPEARDAAKIDDPMFGKVREPFVRWVQLGRTFHATSDSGQYRHFGGTDTVEGPDNDSVALAQYPFFAPSVFNFFSPEHQPAGPLTAAGLVAPEMEIVHAYTAIATVNLIDRAVIEEEYIFDRDESVWLDLDGEVDAAIAGPTQLIDRLDLLLTYGTLSAGTRQIVLDAILPLAGEPYDQVVMALYLILVSPEYSVQR